MKNINKSLLYDIGIIVGAIVLVFSPFLIRKTFLKPNEILLAPTITPIPAIISPTFGPTPTLAPGQKAIYTFYIQTTSHGTANKTLHLNPSDSGKTFTVNIGAYIILSNFSGGGFHVSSVSPQNIFTPPVSTSLPNSVPFNAIGVLGVFHPGFGTIVVAETK